MMKLHEKEMLEIKVVEYLFTYKNQWVVAQELKKELKIGFTILHRILDSLSQRLSLQKIELIVSKNKGIKIICGDDYPIQKVFESIYTSSLVYKIIVAHFNESYISTTNFAIENYTSTATLQRKIRQINKYISIYNIYLKRGKMEGDEESIRKFIFTYLWNIHRSNIMHKFSLFEGEKLVSFLEEKTGLKLTQVGKEKFLLYHCITNLRERKHNHLTDISQNIKLVSKFSNCFSEFEKEFKDLYDKEGINLRFLLFVFLAFQDNYHNISALSMDQLYKALINNFNQHKKNRKIDLNEIDDSVLINYLVIEFEKRITLSYNRMKKKEIILEVFSMCWQANIMILDLFGETFYTCTKKIREEFPYFFQELTFLIPRSYKKATQKILLEALCAIALKINISMKLSKVFYITIILTKGEIYEDITKDILKRTLSYKYMLKFLPKDHSHKADLIITDFPQLMSENKNILFIQNDIISVNHIVKIGQFLSEKQKSSQEELAALKVSEANINI